MRLMSCYRTIGHRRSLARCDGQTLTHEWQAGEGLLVKDASGNLLANGDTITVIKDLKIKGSSSVVKVDTKVKSSELRNWLVAPENSSALKRLTLTLGIDTY